MLDTEVSEEVRQAVGSMYAAYVEAFNAADVDGCVNTFVTPYFDIVNLGDQPLVRIIETEADCRRYFAEHPYFMRPADRRVVVTVLEIGMRQLAPNMVFLSTEVQRRRPDGSIAGRTPPDGKYRNHYVVLQNEQRWAFAGYVSDYPRESLWT